MTSTWKGHFVTNLRILLFFKKDLFIFVDSHHICMTRKWFTLQPNQSLEAVVYSSTSSQQPDTF